MKLSVREHVYAGEGGSYRRYEIWSDTPVNGIRHVADIGPIEDEGKRIAERIVEAFNKEHAQ